MVEEQELLSRVSQFAESKDREEYAKCAEIRKEILQILSLPTIAPHVLVFISSLSPGTGASTARNLLAEILGYEEPNEDSAYRLQRDAGKYRRILAALWKYWLSRFKKQSSETSLNKFWSWLVKNPDMVQNIAKNREYAAFDEETLKEFSSVLREFTNPQTSQKWTRFPDEQIWKRITAEHEKGGVFTGKLTAIIDYLLQNRVFVEGWGVPIVRFLLTVDPEVGAQRVTQRDMESGKINVAPKGSPKFQEAVAQKIIDNQGRIEQDWEEYFRIYKMWIAEEMIKDEYNVVSVDTTKSTPSEVVTAMLLTIWRQLVPQSGGKESVILE